MEGPLVNEYRIPSRTPDGRPHSVRDHEVPATGAFHAHVVTPLVLEEETICTISDHFSTEDHVVEALFTGIPVGVLENPVALPGHQLCHLARIDQETHAEIEAEIDRGEFARYRMLGVRWMGDGEEAE